jgi:hypothetical protein
MIHREILRVLVLHHLWQPRGARTTAQDNCALTTPSLLSRGTRHKSLRSIPARVVRPEAWPEWDLSYGSIDGCVEIFRAHKVDRAIDNRDRRGAPVHNDRRSLRVVIHPLLERGNLVGRVLPNFGRGNIARINVGRMLLRTNGVVQAATDVKLLPTTSARPIQAAFVNARRHLRPSAWRCSCQACATVTIDAKTVHSAKKTTSTINPCHVNGPFCTVPVVIVIR